MALNGSNLLRRLYKVRYDISRNGSVFKFSLFIDFTARRTLIDLYGESNESSSKESTQFRADAISEAATKPIQGLKLKFNMGKLIVLSVLVAAGAVLFGERYIAIRFVHF